MSKEIKTQEQKTAKKNKKYIILAFVVILAIIGIMMNNSSEEATVGTTTIATTERSLAPEGDSFAEESVTARIDITTPLVKADEPQFEVYVDGSEEPLKQERWLPKYGSQGYMIQRDMSPQDITIKTLKEIDIKISLRGIWDTDNKEKLLTHKVTYTKASINGVDILEQPQTVWFREPFQYILSVTPGEEYKIHVEWVKSGK